MLFSNVAFQGQKIPGKACCSGMTGGLSTCAVGDIHCKKGVLERLL